MSIAATTDEPLAPEFDPVPVVMPVRHRGRFRRLIGIVGSVAEWCFGVATLLVGLAVLASVPVGQFLALGYCLEASGRVARSGRIRDGLIGVRTAAKFGGCALAGFLLWLPLLWHVVHGRGRDHRPARPDRAAMGLVFRPSRYSSRCT